MYITTYKVINSKKCRALCKKNKIYGNYKLFAPLDVGTRRAAFFEEKKSLQQNATRRVPTWLRTYVLSSLLDFLKWTQ